MSPCSKEVTEQGDQVKPGKPFRTRELQGGNENAQQQSYENPIARLF
jgi:hypothetical protein